MNGHLKLYSLLVFLLTSQESLTQCNDSTREIEIPEFEPYLFKFPENGTYERNQTCRWIFTTEDDRLLIYSSIADSFVDCGDSLVTYDGNTSAKPLESNGCSKPMGATKPGRLTSGNTMFVELITDDTTVTDGTKTETGFRLQMIAGYDKSFSEQACVSTKYLTAYSTRQYLTSPNFPKKGLKNLTCQWIITAKEEAANVSIEVEFLDLDEYNGCVDKLIVSEDSEVKLSVCGRNKFITNYSYTSSGTNVTLSYTTDKYGPFRGFSLSYTQNVHPSSTLIPDAVTPQGVTNRPVLLTETPSVPCNKSLRDCNEDNSMTTTKPTSDVSGVAAWTGDEKFTLALGIAVFFFWAFIITLIILIAVCIKHSKEKRKSIHKRKRSDVRYHDEPEMFAFKAYEYDT